MNDKRILIIEDEFPIRYLIEHQLKGYGYAILLAKDGPEGLNEALKSHPDLIVLDAMMPGMDGFEVCLQIKGDPDTADIPVIFLTANQSEEYRNRAFQVGADDFMTKPFTADDLVGRISAILRHDSEEEIPVVEQPQGHIISMFSPKGGVGTTSVAIQLAESIALHDQSPVVLMDLALPFGTIGLYLNLQPKPNVLDLLVTPQRNLNLEFIGDHVHIHRNYMYVIPAPVKMIMPDSKSLASNLRPLLDLLIEAGNKVILDLGSNLSHLSRIALQYSDIIFSITSGDPISNRLVNDFINASTILSLEQRKIMPVINDIYDLGNQDIELARVPVAHLPKNEKSNETGLWVKEQGLRKLVAVIK